MSITYVHGNLFESPARVLVNTVNTGGVMGKGVALQFRNLFPLMYTEYRSLCEAGKIDIGTLHLYKTSNKWVLNFPTKTTWRQPSQVAYIVRGLRRLAETYESQQLYSLAMPLLGCGNGQLDWETQVRPLVHEYLEDLPIDVFVYPGYKKPALPEHKDVKAMSEWLMSEPKSLPFEEVWLHLRSLVDVSEVFETVSGNSYEVTLHSEPEEAVIRAAGKTYRIGRDALTEFWQELRHHGISSRATTPQNLRPSHLMPLFDRLPYVHRVQVARSGEALLRQPSSALQVIAPTDEFDPIGPLFQTSFG